MRPAGVGERGGGARATNLRQCARQPSARRGAAARLVDPPETARQEVAFPASPPVHHRAGCFRPMRIRQRGAFDHENALSRHRAGRPRRGRASFRLHRELTTTNNNGPTGDDAGETPDTGTTDHVRTPAPSVTDDGAVAVDSGDAATTPTPQAYIRVAHWSPDAPAVDVCINDGGRRLGGADARSSRRSSRTRDAGALGDGGRGGDHVPAGDVVPHHPAGHLRRAPRGRRVGGLLDRARGPRVGDDRREHVHDHRRDRREARPWAATRRSCSRRSPTK